MKRTNIFILLTMAVASIVSTKTVVAQQNYTDQIVIENHAISKKANVVTITMDANLNNLRIDRNEMLIITPVIMSLDGAHMVSLEPFAVKGELRNKVLNRPFKRKGREYLTMPQAHQIVRNNGTKQKLHYSTTLPYQEWQRQAQMLLKTEVVGCADCTQAEKDKTAIAKILPDKFIPDYRTAYIVPKVEPIKQRSERFSAHLNYIVGRHDLLPNFKNNAQELAKVNRIIEELRRDKDLTITDFKISGYASPEGSKESNLLLSQRRAETFARYIERKYGYTRNQVNVEWHGEDWGGLRKAVSESSLTNKQEIIDIIDQVDEIDTRDAKLVALDNGKTYQQLLTDFYPALRRNDYDIAFISRPFNVEEAKEVIKKRPKMLSLNEMYLVAKTFPEDSPQYREVFAIAAQTFPNAQVACLNAAVSELRANKPDAALKYLEKSAEGGAALNLKGVAYAQKGENERAKSYFERAIQKGNAHARHNAEQLQMYIEDNL